MQFVDKALARRFESAEEMPQVLYVRVFQKVHPEIGAAEEEICGGHMIFAGVGSPIGRAVGMGVDRPFTADDLDRVEQFYRARNAPSQLDVCPLHDPELFEMFKERGYSIAELNNVLYRALDVDEKFPPVPVGCEIRCGRADEAEAASGIVERAFFPEGAPKEFAGLLTPLYQMEDGLTFVASIGGEMAACGAGLIIREQKVFALFGAGTRIEFRGRGLQTALLRVRMAAAAEAGCEYAVIVTRGGAPRSAMPSGWAFAWRIARSR